MRIAAPMVIAGDGQLDQTDKRLILALSFLPDFL